MGSRSFELKVEFLKARLREDEAVAVELKPGKNQNVAKLRDRVLADVEAKRRLMDWAMSHLGTAWKAEAEAIGLPAWQRMMVDAAAGVPEFLRKPVIDELVAAYADHPDFRAEWLPIEAKERRQRDSA